MTASIAPNNDRRIGAPSATSRSMASDEQPPRVRPKWNLIERQQDEAEIARLQRRIDELEMAIMATNKAQRKSEGALAIYGDSEEIKALTARLEFMLPNAQEIGQRGVALVAQIAAAHGLDPLPGSDHLYAWKQGGNLMVVIGYKGMLHLARQQVVFTHQSRPMSAEERQERALPDDQIGYITEVWEIEKAKACKDAGIPYFPIRGEAVWSKKDGSPPKGRDGAWVCRKNSLKDALRQITSTGMRLGQALDTMFAEMGRKMAIEAGLQMDSTGEGWTIALDDKPERIEAVTQELIDAGVIQPDADQTEVSAKEEVDAAPVVIEQTVQSSAAQAEEPAIPTLFDLPVEETAKPERKGKTRRLPLNEEAPAEEPTAPKCLRCEEAEPTGEDPFPFLCADCARTAGDEEAVAEEKAA